MTSCVQFSAARRHCCTCLPHRNSRRHRPGNGSRSCGGSLRTRPCNSRGRCLKTAMTSSKCESIIFLIASLCVLVSRLEMCCLIMYIFKVITYCRWGLCAHSNCCGNPKRQCRISWPGSDRTALGTCPIRPAKYIRRTEDYVHVYMHVSTNGFSKISFLQKSFSIHVQ